MGWTNSHLHMVIHPTGHYGTPDPDLPLHDERKATLRDLAGRVGAPSATNTQDRWAALPGPRRNHAFEAGHRPNA